MTDSPSLFEVQTSTGAYGAQTTTYNFNVQVTEPRARRTDPVTSHAAAKSVRGVSQAHENLLEVLLRFGPQTDEQIAMGYLSLGHTNGWKAMSPSGLRTRRAELVDQGKVRDTGRRSTTASGRQTIVWEAM